MCGSHAFLSAPAGWAQLWLPAYQGRLEAERRAAMFDRYHVVERGSVVAEWPRLRGWNAHSSAARSTGPSSRGAEAAS